MYKVAISGAYGKMGEIAQYAIASSPDFECILCIGSKDNYESMLLEKKPDIIIDFTNPDVVYRHAKIALSLGIRPVIGTSGLDSEQIYALQQYADSNKTAGIIAPNFSISAMLMQKFSRVAAKHYASANIVEQHHIKKQDAPSGTAINTAEIISASGLQGIEHASRETKPGALGAEIAGISIQSIRRPGVIAKQSVIFANEHETLEIVQESVTRKSFVAGILLACRSVVQIQDLRYGLDEFL